MSKTSEVVSVRDPVCVDFSDVRMRYADDVWFPLNSTLSFKSRIGNGGSAELEIVKVGSGRELKWKSTEPRVVLTGLYLNVLGYESPLVKPLTVTIDVYLTETDAPGLILRGYYLDSAGQIVNITDVLRGQSGELSITFPRGAFVLDDVAGPPAGFQVCCERWQGSSMIGNLKWVRVS